MIFDFLWATKCRRAAFDTKELKGKHVLAGRRGLISTELQSYSLRRFCAVKSTPLCENLTISVEFSATILYVSYTFMRTRKNRKNVRISEPVDICSTLSSKFLVPLSSVLHFFVPFTAFFVFYAGTSPRSFQTRIQPSFLCTRKVAR